MWTTRAGSGSVSVVATVATASVGETIAPSVKATASGNSGIIQCSRYPIATTVSTTRPSASSSTGFSTRTKSRRGSA